MPLSVPFLFGTAGLATPTSRLDADYQAITDYINARNPTVGPIALRPATGNSGAIYVASDQANRTYVDDGALWQEISAAEPTIPTPIPTGTSMLFNMDAAPVGWTRDNNAAYNDRVVRIVTGSRVHGGSWFVSGFIGAAHAHSVSAVQTGVGGDSGGATGSAIQVSRNSHTHSVPAHNTNASGVIAVSNDSNWRPLHRDVIICAKD